MANPTNKVHNMTESEIAIWVIKNNPEKAMLYYNNNLQPVIKTQFPIDELVFHLVLL